jgi:hypothetical protein
LQQGKAGREIPPRFFNTQWHLCNLRRGFN